MNVLVIGSGGREHAICWALGRSESVSRVLCAPGNPGIAQVAECVPIPAHNLPALAEFALEQKIDLTVPGSEGPLAAGLGDLFAARSLPFAGPGHKAARLETSKIFAKNFMSRHRIPTARYRVASSSPEAREILTRPEFSEYGGRIVIKADGLAAGKGVVVAGSRAEAESAIVSLMEKGVAGIDASSRVVIEEALTGREASLLIFTDGKNYAVMPPARDHKRLGENDTGPNTGGMGAITGPMVLGEAALSLAIKEIVQPTLEGLAAEGIEFRGVLYFGLMLTEHGPRLLEYNVRFGDPEAQALLVRLNSDLGVIFQSIAQRKLKDDIEWSGQSSACVVLATRGYPEAPEKGNVIEGLEDAARLPYVHIFHAGTARTQAGSLATAGGRVLGVTALSDTLDEALELCYRATGYIQWEGMHYRRDIGSTSIPKATNA